ncbi:MAG: hypothetical protein LUM44_10015 [Pyrinomonadaceae bacterium]|nr:hypothetical protein [Pyrinomonadaceae bacterium]
MANTNNSSEPVRFWLQVPVEVNEVIVSEAKKNRRSRTQHVLFILEQYAEEIAKEESKEVAA